MTHLITRTAPAPPALRRFAAAAPGALLLAAIGIEVLALVALLPRTLDVWAHPARFGYGDFNYFYESSRSLSFSGTYNPALAVLLHPLTYLSMTHAFQVYFAANVVAMLGVAYLAQRAVDAPLARIALALGIIALPQAHWALRVGHFTEILAFVALAGFLAAPRRPVIAGMLLAALALKPLYLPVPVLYLLFTRNWRALATLSAIFAVMSVAGVAAAGVSITQAAGYYADRIAYVAKDIVVGQDQLLLPVQQSWQYSWRGFLVSAGIEPNPLLVADLLALSAAAVAFAWWRATPPAARAAAAIGMLLLAPYSTFYNWSMIAVAAALLVRSELRPRWLTPCILAALALSAAATQAATPFPSPDQFAPATTRGFYWLPLVALASVFAIAIAGRRPEVAAIAPPAPSARERVARALPMPLPGLLTGVVPRATAAACVVAVGYLAAAYVSHNAPFAPQPYFSRSEVVGALPDDFPLPPGATMRQTGSGSTFPYRIEWNSDLRTSEVAGIMTHRLQDGAWKITRSSAAGNAVALHTARDAAGIDGDLVGDVSLVPSATGTLIRLEFSPLPPTRVARYDRWLEDQGLIVKNVAPEDYDRLRR